MSSSTPEEHRPATRSRKRHRGDEDPKHRERRALRRRRAVGDRSFDPVMERSSRHALPERLKRRALHVRLDGLRDVESEDWEVYED